MLGVGFSTMVGIPPTPFPEIVRWAGEHRIPYLEVCVGPTFPAVEGADYPGHLDLAAIVQDGPDPVLELLDRHGVRIAALAPMLNLLHPDPATRADLVAAFRLTLRAAAQLGVGTVVTFAGSAHGMHFWGLPGLSDHPTSRVADNLRLFQAVYAPLAAEAEDLGLRIAFETAGRGGGWGNLAHAPALWDRMFDTVPSPALGLSFDPSHLVWLHIPDPPGLIRRYGDRIYHVDGKDCEIRRERLAVEGILGNGWWRYRLPGLGELAWPAILAALWEIGYRFAISIENEDDLVPGLPGVAAAAEYLRNLMRPFTMAERVES